jgi:hypothetical protein
VVDGGGLENHCSRKVTGGSNPSPSASLRYTCHALRRTRGWQAKRRMSRRIAQREGEITAPSYGCVRTGIVRLPFTTGGKSRTSS